MHQSPDDKDDARPRSAALPIMSAGALGGKAWGAPLLQSASCGYQRGISAPVMARNQR